MMRLAAGLALPVGAKRRGFGGGKTSVGQESRGAYEA
jgi:hypothetical protein